MNALPRRIVALRADGFYSNGLDGLRQLVSTGPGDRVTFRDLAAPLRRASRRDMAAQTTTAAQMRSWGAIEVDFQTATAIQARLEAAQARITTPQREWLLAAFPLAGRPVHEPMPVVAVAATSRSLVQRLRERGIVAPVATPGGQDDRVRLSAEVGLPLLRVLHAQPPLLDFPHPAAAINRRSSQSP